MIDTTNDRILALSVNKSIVDLYDGAIVCGQNNKPESLEVRCSIGQVWRDVSLADERTVKWWSLFCSDSSGLLRLRRRMCSQMFWWMFLASAESQQQTIVADELESVYSTIGRGRSVDDHEAHWRLTKANYCKPGRLNIKGTAKRSVVSSVAMRWSEMTPSTQARWRCIPWPRDSCETKRIAHGSFQFTHSETVNFILDFAFLP